MTSITRNWIGVFVLILLLSGQVGAHEISGCAIVDTDMGLDDIRAITMLLNSGVVQTPLFVTSDGAVSPQAGARNLRQLLNHFRRGDIKIAEGRDLERPAPPWRALSSELRFPDGDVRMVQTTPAGGAAEEIVKALKSSNDEIIYLCIGPLTNLADALRVDRTVRDKISYVLYLGTPPDAPNPGWNTTRDPDSAISVFKTGIPVFCIGLPNEQFPLFDATLLQRIKAIQTPAARFLVGLHEQPPVSKLIDEKHLRIWDEMAVLYMNQPGLFRFQPTEGGKGVMSLATYQANKIANLYVKLLSNQGDIHLSPREAVILKAFPSKSSLFKDDVAPFVRKIIEKHGFEEWKACLLTNELHRHLGGYSLIGAKMGVRAREVLEAPFDQLEVVSFAGLKPPLSCLNDGLQVSTGASLGRGTIQVVEQPLLPSAVFKHNNARLRLTLKPAQTERIVKDVKAGVAKYGDLSAEYFSYIRKLSIQYWLDLDRRQIFEEVME